MRPSSVSPRRRRARTAPRSALRCTPDHGAARCRRARWPGRAGGRARAAPYIRPSFPPFAAFPGAAESRYHALRKDLHRRCRRDAQVAQLLDGAASARSRERKGCRRAQRSEGRATPVRSCGRKGQGRRCRARGERHRRDLARSASTVEAISRARQLMSLPTCRRERQSAPRAPTSKCAAGARRALRVRAAATTSTPARRSAWTDTGELSGSRSRPRGKVARLNRARPFMLDVQRVSTVRCLSPT